MLASQWVRDALAHAGMPGAELARRLSDTLGRPIDRAAVQKMTIVKTRGRTKARRVTADEMMAISQITGFPLPNSVLPAPRGVRSSGNLEVIEPEIRAGGGAHGLSFGDELAAVSPGLAISAESIRDRWGIPTAFMRGELRVAGDAAVVEIYGDSMYDPNEPGAPGSLFPGDRVIVDTGDRTPSPPGHFLVWDGAGLVVKLVEIVRGTRDPAKIRLKSRNPRYDPYEATEDEARIIGRVRGRISAM